MAKTAQQFFTLKTGIPTDMLTAQMRALPADLRERAFWSAGVESAELLAGLRGIISKTQRSEISMADAHMEMGFLLERTDYRAAPGTELKNLYSYRRQKVLLETNLAAAAGYEQRVKAMQDLDMWPAWELARRRYSRAPRDWEGIWTSAGGKVFDGGRMAALVTDNIWYAVNKFGVNYPPFDFGSGMGVEPVPRDEAVEMGLLSDADTVEPDFDTPTINSDLAAGIDADEATWREVLDNFKGFAERKGGTLLFTDPNGTKPYHPAQLANLIDEQLPEGFDNLQRGAVVQWTCDHTKITGNPDGDDAEHFRRFVSRTIPKRESNLCRGLSFATEAERNAFIKKINNKNELRLDNAFSSFSRSPSTAAQYADKKPFGVLVYMRESFNGKDISPSVRKFYPKNKSEDEIVFGYGTALKVLEDGIENVGGKEFRRLIVSEIGRGQA